MRVVTTAYGKSPVAGVSMHVAAGTRDERGDWIGASHFLSKLALKATHNRSAAQVAHHIASLSGSILAGAMREWTVYSGTSHLRDIHRTFGYMADAAQNLLITPEDMAPTRMALAYEMDQCRRLNVPAYLSERAHQLAYGRGGQAAEGLALSLFGLDAAGTTLDDRTADHVLAYHDAYFKRPQHYTISGAGIPHEVLLDLVQEHFSTMSTGKAPPPPREKAMYVGGEARIHVAPSDTVAPAPDTTTAPDAHDTQPLPPPAASGPPMTHLCFAFEGLSQDDPDNYAVALLACLLGGGSSFSSGGPGKGMYTRLYADVLNRHGWIDEAHAHFLPYVDSGLFLVTAACPAPYVAHMVDILASELERAATRASYPSEDPQPASASGVGLLGRLARRGGGPTRVSSGDELHRAKNQATSAYLAHLESRASQAEDAFTSLQLDPARLHGPTLADALVSPPPPLLRTPAYHLARLRAVTADDLARVARRLFYERPLTFVAQGDVSALPELKDICQHYGFVPPPGTL